MIEFGQFLKNAFYPLIHPIRLGIARYKLRVLIARRHSLKIVIGSGGIYQDGWILTDIDTLNLLKPSDWKRYFSKSSIDALLAEHVWEHLTIEEGFVAAKNCYDYIRVGGYVRIAVPDGYHPSAEYINWIRPGGKGPGSADHKILYNCHSISEVFRTVGFDVRLLEYFDKSGEFHFTDWEPRDGMIYRSKRFDERNQDGALNYTSIILDAIKIREVPSLTRASALS